MATSVKTNWTARKDLRALAGIVVVGALVLLLAWWLRLRVQQPPLPPAPSVVRSLGELVALGEKARGSQRMITYTHGDLARVAEPAIGKNTDGVWRELPLNTVLEVDEIELQDEDAWVHVRAQGVPKPEHLLVHTSFLEAYRPVVLDKILEISGVRFVRVPDDAARGLTVDGWLRNITARPLTKCVVACVFRDERRREVETKLTTIAELPPGQLYAFQAAGTTKPFASVSIEITHATPDGLRDYLSIVDINRSVE